MKNVSNFTREVFAPANACFSLAFVFFYIALQGFNNAP